MDTETIDRLYLELSQFTTATTAKELALQALNLRLAAALADFGRLQNIVHLVPQSEAVEELSEKHATAIAEARQLLGETK